MTVDLAVADRGRKCVNGATLAYDEAPGPKPTWLLYVNAPHATLGP